MSYFDSTDPLTLWQSQTKSKIASNRGQHQPTLLKVDALLGQYKTAATDSDRLGIVEALCFMIQKWISVYTGSRLNAAKELLKDAQEKRDSFLGKGVKPTLIPEPKVAIPKPVYPEMLARNKNPGDKYFTLGMLRDGGLGKDLNNGSLVSNLKHNEDDPDQWSGLTYMTEEQRMRFLVEANGGLLYHKGNPSPLDTSKSHVTQQPVSTKVYIFVMDGNGRIFSAAKSDVEHHSSFLAGNPAAAAGLMRVINGNIDYVNAESGHYQPMKEDIDQFIAELKARGIDTSKIDIAKVGERSVRQANAKSKDTSRVRLYPTGPREERC